jgi:hypothetical protein
MGNEARRIDGAHHMGVKYTEQGIPANVIGKTADGKHVIQHVNTAYGEDGDEYETNGQIEVYDGKLLEKRPEPNDNGMISKLKAERDNLSSAISTLRNEKALLVKEKEAMAVKLESISPTVARVLKFVEGKFDQTRSHGLGYILAKCKTYGVAVPEAILAFDRGQKLTAAKAEAAKAEGDLEKSRKLIADLEATA